jgi:hypothetical protein
MDAVTPWGNITGAAVLWRVRNALPNYVEGYVPAMRCMWRLMDEIDNENMREAARLEAECRQSAKRSDS